MSIEATVLIGAGGHAKVVLSLLKNCGLIVLGLVDSRMARGDLWYGLKCLGNDSILEDYASTSTTLSNGIGSLPGNDARRRFHEVWSEAGLPFSMLVHSHAFVDESVVLGAGTQVMAGAVIQAGARIGENVIVNTGAVIDHDCEIADHVHVAPGAVLSGGVRVGTATHIGTGACVIQQIAIGSDVVIGAGAAVTKSVEDGHIVYPARSMAIRRGKRL